VLAREVRIAHAAFLIGVAAAALQLAVDYTGQRHQFGRPIGSFQAVQHALADRAIEIDAARLTLLQAAHDHDEALAGADRSSLVASWWARTAVEETVYRAQHVHGGMGVDIEYPLHRYFLLGRRSALAFGSSEAVLEALGDDLALAGAST